MRVEGREGGHAREGGLGRRYVRRLVGRLLGSGVLCEVLSWCFGRAGGGGLVVGGEGCEAGEAEDGVCREAGGIEAAAGLLDGGGVGEVDRDGLDLGLEVGDEGFEEAEGVGEVHCRGVADAEGVGGGDGGEAIGDWGGGDVEGEGFDGGVEGLGEGGEGVAAGIDGLEEEGLLGRGGDEEGGGEHGWRRMYGIWAGCQ